MLNYTKKITNIIETEVLILGGGPTGFASAVAAARNGAKTLLIEKTGVLGGTATSGLVGPFMCCYDNDGEEQLVKGIFDELCCRAEALGGAIHPSKVPAMSSFSGYHKISHHNVTPYLSETIALVMDEMLLESGADLLLDTQLIDIIAENGIIKYAIIANKEFISAVKADIYIDCSGDADAAYLAGAETWLGDKETGIMQPMTLMFEIDNIDRDEFYGELDKHKEELGNNFTNCFWWYIEKARAAGEWNIDRNEVCNFETSTPGRLKINTTRICGVDGTKACDITQAYIDGRRQAFEIFNFMKKYLPGCKDIRFLQFASRIGVRETRHIVGKYELSTHDVLHRTKFDDAIATFGYAIDLHTNNSAGVFTAVDKYYSIPYRTMLPVGCDNLLVAGRPICGSSEAAASYRVMPCCMAMGQAAGTAAALSRRRNVRVGDVDVPELQTLLKAQGAVIKDL